MRSTLVIAMLLIASTPAVMCRQANVDEWRQFRRPPRGVGSRNLVFKAPMAVSFPSDDVFDEPRTSRFQQQVMSAGGFMSLSEGDAFNHPNSEPDIITAPPAIVQLVVRTAMGDKNLPSVKEVDSDGVEVTTVASSSVTPSAFKSSGKVEHGEGENLQETSTQEMEPFIVTEAGDRNPFPNMEQFLPTSRFRTPGAAVAQNRLGQWSRGSHGDAGFSQGWSARQQAFSGLDAVTTAGTPIASSSGSPFGFSSPAAAGDGRRRNKIVSWRKRLLPRPGVTPRSRLSPSLRIAVNSHQDEHSSEHPPVRQRVTTLVPPVTQPKRPLVARPTRPRSNGNKGYPPRPHWPPLGADDKEVVDMATMDISRLPTTAERAISSSFAPQSPSTSSSTAVTRSSSEIASSSETTTKSTTTSANSTMKPTTGDGMATGSDHEELWVTPKVEIRSSSRPYHEIVSPGAIWHHQHEQQPNHLISPPSGTLLPVKNIFPPSSGSTSEDFDGFYGEPVPSEVIFPNGSRILTAVGNIVDGHVRLSTDQVSESTTPSGSLAPGGVSTQHPPYVYNGGYTSPRPILFEEDEGVSIEKSSARHDVDTSTLPSISSTEIIQTIGTYTYPGFTPSFESAGATQAVIAPNTGNDETNNRHQDDDYKSDDYEEEESRRLPATKKGGKLRSKDRKRGRINKDYEEDDTADANSSVKMIEAGIVREVVLDTEKLAYILIGTCCALSVVCLVVVVISMRCRKFCRLRRLASSSSDDLLKHHHHHHHSKQHQQQVHHAKFVDWEDGVLESHVSVRSGSIGNEATTHRLGTWFNGRSGLHGTNMALPMGFKTNGSSNQLLRSNSKRGAYYVDGKTSATRDLVSINSENSAGRHRRRRKTGTVGYRVDATSSSPFDSSRGSSDDDVEVESSEKRLVSNKEEQPESVRLSPTGADEEQVEIVNFRKLPSPQFPSSANNPSANSKDEDIYTAVTTTDENSSDWTTSNGAAARRDGGSSTSSEEVMIHESNKGNIDNKGVKNGNSSSSSGEEVKDGDKEMILWSSNDDRLI